MSDSSVLFQPYTFHSGARAKHRITLAPLTNLQSYPSGVCSPEELDLDDTIQVAQWLVEDGADFIDLSLWNYQRKTLKRPDEHPLPLFRAALPSDVAIFAAGAMWSREDARTVLDLGADFVSLGRAAIVDPDWPKHARQTHFEPRRAPLTPEQYRQNGLSDPFIQYLRGFKRMVADSAG